VKTQKKKISAIKSEQSNKRKRMSEESKGEYSDRCEAGPETEVDPSYDDEEFTFPNKRNTSNITFNSICVGDKYDILDSTNRWCEGEVRATNHFNFKFFINL
jgi:hypothetical protein